MFCRAVLQHVGGTELAAKPVRVVAELICPQCPNRLAHLDLHPTHLCRRCLFTMSNHTQAVTQVKWGGDGLIYSAARDCSINVWAAEDGRMVRRSVQFGWYGGLLSGLVAKGQLAAAGRRIGRLPAACLTPHSHPHPLPPHQPYLLQPQGAWTLGQHNEPQHRLCAADRRL